MKHKPDTTYMMLGMFGIYFSICFAFYFVLALVGWAVTSTTLVTS